MLRARTRKQRARRRTDRRGQDDRRRVRGLPRHAAPAREGVLHRPDEGAEQPEVPGVRGRIRRERGRSAHRRHQHQLGRAHRGDDHRGAAQHAVRRLRPPHRPRVRGDGRGALPRRPVPRRGVGGGHHPPPRARAARVAERHGVERRGVRRLAAGGARRDRGDRVGGTPGAPRPAHPHAHASSSTCSTRPGSPPRTA